HGRLLRKGEDGGRQNTRTERAIPEEQSTHGNGRRRRRGLGEAARGADFRGAQRVSASTPAERVEAWSRGTLDERLADAREYYTTLSDTARKFLDLLLDDQRPEIPASELIEKLGLESNRVLAGSLSSFGRKARRIGRLQPFGFQIADDGSTVYAVPTEVADLFRQARG
ncbi:MAG: DUF6416 domain-containing protein, partial [Chloroflexota bacterium]|nr:DUF6416 domain-containing protein [Chloroflexota bacterium]